MIFGIGADPQAAAVSAARGRSGWHGGAGCARAVDRPRRDGADGQR